MIGIGTSANEGETVTTYTWNVASGFFNTAGDWTPNGVPGASDTALFGASTGTSTIGGNGTAALIQVGAGGAYNFISDLSGGSILDLGSITVASGATMTATAGVFAVAGAANATGTLIVNGTVRSSVAAQTASNEITVGGSSGSVGSIIVNGANGRLDGGANPGGIGNLGSGTLTVGSGALATFASSNSAVLAGLSSARAAGSSGTINVTGANAVLSVNGYVYVGRAGTATLNITNGGTFNGGVATVGSTGGYALTIGDGSPATDSNGNPTASPDYGGRATALVSGAASTLHSYNQLRVGYRGTTGSLTVDAGTARADTNIVVGGGTDRTGAAGTLTVQNGGNATAGGQHVLATAGVVFGNDAGTTGSGTVTGNGSVLNANGDRLTVGGSGSGSLVIVNGGRALAGSAGYSDVEAALAVAGNAGSTGTVTVSGLGSVLTANGDAVIGGNERGAGPTVGGTGTVSVTGGALLSIAGTTTIQAGGTLTVDASSSLSAATVSINGGKANLATLSSANTINFGSGGTLAVATVSGANTVKNFGFGDRIDLLGTTNATVSGNVVTTATGSITLGAAPANTSYQAFSDGNGGSLVALTPKTIGVYRFFDSSYGTHFYTASASEAQAVAAARPDLVAEGPGGIGLQAVAVAASDPNAVSVYRFFDNTYGTHFFTANADERNAVIATRADLTYEASSTFYEHGTAQPGDTPVYRFFDNVRGTHFYTDDPAERASIVANRPDLVAEGIGFYEPRANALT